MANIYTMEELLAGMNYGPCVTAVTVEEDVFRDWCGLQDELNTGFPLGQVKKNHLFTVEQKIDNDSSCMILPKMSCHESDAGQKVMHNYFKDTTTARCAISAKWSKVLKALG